MLGIQVLRKIMFSLCRAVEPGSPSTVPSIRAPELHVQPQINLLSCYSAAVLQQLWSVRLSTGSSKRGLLLESSAVIPSSLPFNSYIL